MINMTLQNIESITKIISNIAIPIIIAIAGWMIQDELSERSLKKDYLQIAVGILSNPSNSKETEALRPWATMLQLLLEKLPKDVNRVEALKAIMIDRLQLLAYSRQLEAVLEACRGDIQTPTIAK